MKKFNNVSLILTILFSLVLVSVNSSEANSPIRFRISSTLLYKILHKNDQDILNLYKDMNLGNYKISEN